MHDNRDKLRRMAESAMVCDGSSLFFGAYDEAFLTTASRCQETYGPGTQLILGLSLDTGGEGAQMFIIEK